MLPPIFIRYPDPGPAFGTMGRLAFYPSRVPKFVPLSYRVLPRVTSAACTLRPWPSTPPSPCLGGHKGSSSWF